MNETSQKTATDCLAGFYLKIKATEWEKEVLRIIPTQFLKNPVVLEELCSPARGGSPRLTRFISERFITVHNGIKYLHLYLRKRFYLRKRYLYFYEKPRLETAFIKRGFLCLKETLPLKKPLQR